MKLFIKFLLFVLVLGLAGPFFLRSPNGEPYLDYREFVPSVSSIKEKANGIINTASGSSSDNLPPNEEIQTSDGKVQVYRWQDENGVWQYSDRPPTGIDRQTISVNTNENILPSQSIAEETENEVEEAQDNSEEGADIALPLPLTVPVNQVPQLIEDAKEIQELMNQRSEILESINGEPGE